MFASPCCIFIFIAGPSHFLLHNAVVLVLLMNKTNNAETSTVLSVDLFISTLQLFQIGWCFLFLLFTEMPLENLHFFRMTSIINARRPSSRTRPFLPLLAHNQSFQDFSFDVTAAPSAVSSSSSLGFGSRWWNKIYIQIQQKHVILIMGPVFLDNK